MIYASLGFIAGVGIVITYNIYHAKALAKLSAEVAVLKTKLHL